MPRKQRIGVILLWICSVLGACVIAFFLVAFIGFQQDMSAARRRLASIPTEVFKTQYGDIEYLVAGNGPTVLISHGVTGGLDQGMSLTDKWGFFGQGYRFVYVSRFGYLKSPLPKDASARLQAAAYKDLLDHIGVDRVFVFGNSAGGPSSMWFAIDYPERTKGLILHSSAVPGPLPGHPPRLLFEHDFLYWATIKAFPDILIGFVLPNELRSTLTEKEKAFVIGNVFMAGLPVSDRAAGIIFDNEVSTPSVNDIPFEKIGSPTLILQAIDDPRERAGGSELARRVTGSDYVGLTGGHLLMRQEKRILTEIAEFIEGHK